MAVLPLLIAPLQRQPLPGRFAALFANDYTLGWLIEGENGAHWMTWGSAADRDSALRCRDEVLARSCPREVLIWHQPLPKDLTPDQVAIIRAAQAG